MLSNNGAHFANVSSTNSADMERDIGTEASVVTEEYPFRYIFTKEPNYFTDALYLLLQRYIFDGRKQKKSKRNVRSYCNFSW